jgi:hypothetical protein
VGRWLKDVEKGKLLGDGDMGKGGGRSGGMGKGGDPFVEHSEGKERRDDKVDEIVKERDEGKVEKVKVEEEEVRVIVIGDRRFTDVLLANRLRTALPPTIPKSTTATHEESVIPSTISVPSSKPQDRVLSILTTDLPQPNDLRPIRYLENTLSQNLLRVGTEDWGRYTLSPLSALSEPPPREKGSLVDRWKGFMDDVRGSRMGWDPRQWTFLSVVVGFGRGSRGAGRGLYRGALWVMTKLRRRIGNKGGEAVSVNTTEAITQAAPGQPSNRIARAITIISGTFARLMGKRTTPEGGQPVSIPTAGNITASSS